MNRCLRISRAAENNFAFVLGANTGVYEIVQSLVNELKLFIPGYRNHFLCKLLPSKFIIVAFHGYIF